MQRVHTEEHGPTVRSQALCVYTASHTDPNSTVLSENKYETERNLLHKTTVLIVQQHIPKNTSCRRVSVAENSDARFTHKGLTDVR